MHLSDALISPVVAGAGFIVAASLVAVSINRLRKEADNGLLPLAGVLGAFILVAQMINFSIPGTGSSGHIVGGVMLAILLGPWAAFLTLSSVIIVQCLLFADGGLLALGCNVVNMAAMSCLVAYPLLYAPLSGKMRSRGGLMSLTVLTCALSATLGAIGVVVDVSLSRVASLPALTFISFMLPIHLVIGIIEGIVTRLVVSYVETNRPAFVVQAKRKRKRGGLVVAFAVVTLLLLAIALLFSSSDPDGLEWSVQNTIESNEAQR